MDSVGWHRPHHTPRHSSFWRTFTQVPSIAGSKAGKVSQIQEVTGVFSVDMCRVGGARNISSILRRSYWQYSQSAK